MSILIKTQSAVSHLEMNNYESVKSDEKSEKEEKKLNLKGDYGNVAILLLLYGLQGIPQGIGLAMPILLQNKGVSYTDQAKFSFSFFPYASRLNLLREKNGKHFLKQNLEIGIFVQSPHKAHLDFFGNELTAMQEPIK